MYLLASDYCDSTHMSFDVVFEKLRANGLHSPTRKSLLETFRCVRALAMLARLTQADQELIVIQTEMLLKQLGGPEKTLDFTGNGYEFSGWYTEIRAMILAGFLEYNTRHTMTTTRKFKRMFCEDLQEIEPRFLDYMREAQIMDSIRIDIVNRAKQFELVHLLLAGVYADREPL